MKRFLIAVMLMAVASVLAYDQTGRKQSSQNEKVAQELMQLERYWVTASVKRDKAWLERFFADEFISTHPTSGTIKNKAKEIADTIDPSTAVESMNLGEMQVRVMGDVAVVTGSSSEAGGGGHLTDRNRSYLFTDTFLRRNGRWQIIASHSSRIGCQSSE